MKYQKKAEGQIGQIVVYIKMKTNCPNIVSDKNDLLGELTDHFAMSKLLFAELSWV